MCEEEKTVNGDYPASSFARKWADGGSSSHGPAKIFECLPGRCHRFWPPDSLAIPSVPTTSQSPGHAAAGTRHNETSARKETGRVCRASFSYIGHAITTPKNIHWPSRSSCRSSSPFLHVHSSDLPLGLLLSYLGLLPRIGAGIIR